MHSGDQAARAIMSVTYNGVPFPPLCRRAYHRGMHHGIHCTGHWLRLWALAATVALAVACGSQATSPPDAATRATPVLVASPSATGTPEAIDTADAEPVASTAATPRAQLPVAVFGTSTGGTAVLPIEVPPQTEYGIGLSGRRSLDERGMLFYYAEPVTQAFWMKHTHIDLSIAFIDGTGRVVEVREMHAESLDLVQPATPYRISLEAPSGWYAAHGIAAGAMARFRFRLADYLPGADQIGGGP